VVVNEGSLAPAYRSGPRFPRIRLAEETVPAWRVSEIGLTSESAPTSKGARGIFLACYAPWMLRIAALTHDALLHDIARSAIIGRYTSFPGYHINTARSTVYEKPDFARRAKEELNSTTSIHYNHIWPQLALVLDYLVTDAFAKSAGQVDFPGRYAEGYGYLQQKIYGDRPGRIFDEPGMHLWMPPGVVDVAHPELNYIVARREGTVAVVLTNQSKSSVRSTVRLNPDHVAGAERAAVTVLPGDSVRHPVAARAEGRVAVEVPAGGLIAVLFAGVTPRVQFQNEFLAPGPKLPPGSAGELGFRGARGVAMRFGPRDLTSAYFYLPDFEREISRCTLIWRQGGGDEQRASDAAYPFEFTVLPASDAELEWRVELELRGGASERSPPGRLKLR
jgi:hypothetical protein